MRPLILKISAFGPFADKEIIDFTKVTEYGLFLISGNTGAGKTTIFDAISFALYGAASGEGRDARTVRSDFAKPDCETYVELEFLHKGKKYEVYRKPEQRRPRKKGGGETIAPAEAYLRKPDGSIVTKYKEVTEEIVQILGIDYSQFKQIVMIAQGEFRKFLIADSNSRSDIFRKLFNTQDYERLQKKLSCNSMEVKQKCDDLRKSIDQYISGIKYCIQCEEAGKEAINDDSALNINRVLEALCEMNKRDEALYDKENIAYAEAEKIYEEFADEYNNALKNNQNIDKYHKLTDELNNMKLHKPEMDKLKRQNEYSRNAVYEVAPLEERLQDIKHQIDNYINDSEKLKRKKRLWENKLLGAKGNLKICQEKQAETEDYTIQINLLETGIEKYKEVKKLKNIQTQMVSEIFDLEKAISAQEKVKESLENKILQMKKEFIEPFADSNIEKVKAEVKADILKSRLKKLKSLSEELDNLEVLDIQLSNARVYYNIAQTDYKEAVTEYQRIDEVYYNSQVGMLVGRLKDNEPCPVCGSLSHPKPAKPFDAAITKEELDKAKNNKESLERKRELCFNEIMVYDSKIKTCRELIKKSSAQLQDEIIADLSLMYDSERYDELSLIIKDNYKNAESELKAVLDSIKNLTSQVRRYEYALEQTEYINSRLSESLEKYQSMTAEKRNKESEVKEILAQIKLLTSQIEFSSEEEALQKLDYLKTERESLAVRYQEAQQKEKEAQEECSSLNALIEKLSDDLDNSKERYKSVSAEYLNAVGTYGFTDEENYHEYLITKEKLEEREARVREWQERYTELLSRKSYYEEHIAVLEYKNLDDILLKKNNADEQRNDIRNRISSINIVLQNNKDIYKKLKAKGKDFDKARKEYEVANLLAKTANGDLQGREKVKFEQYVQGVYFKQVLAEANKRLYKMSQGQYVLLKREEALDGRKHSGLEIDVFDYYTGKSRSAASLSGGESFKAALALALGLSDVIQRNNGGIDVDVMFIDEGFGSLDTDSLELAINVLEKISGGSRLIGIISHVAELKERIERQIVIEKTGEGSHITLIENGEGSVIN